MTLQAISIEDLVTATGGCGPGTRCGMAPRLAQPAQPAVSHADQLANGNGGIVPKLPAPPLSHADQLANGNGGIVPKL